MESLPLMNKSHGLSRLAGVLYQSCDYKTEAQHLCIYNAIIIAAHVLIPM